MSPDQGATPTPPSVSTPVETKSAFPWTTDQKETATRIRDTAAFYVKLDLALVAGLGTVVTLLRPERDEIIRAVAALEPVLFALGMAITGALIVYHFAFADAMVASSFRTPRVVLAFILAANVFAVVTMTGQLAGAAHGVNAALERDWARFWVQWSIERHRETRGSYPDSLVFEGQPAAQQAFMELGGAARVSYTRVDSARYVVRLAGKDGKLGTADDETWDQDSWEVHARNMASRGK